MNTPWLLDCVAHLDVLTQRWLDHDLGNRVRVWVRRDDAMHPVINGNKAYKLAFHLEQADLGSTILSCGGVWSNQLHALAFAGREYGVKTAAIVCGYRGQRLTPTMEDCTRWGMCIHLVDRATFVKRRDDATVHDWLWHYGAHHWIPEGANDPLGRRGLAIWAQQIKCWLAQQPVDAVWMEAGTGAMASAMMEVLPRPTTLCVVPVVRDAELERRLRQCAHRTRAKLCVVKGYDGGGFGRVRPELKHFVEAFNASQPFKIEPVYSGKLMVAFLDRAPAVGYSHLIVHSGGLQGLRSQTDW